MTENSVVRLKCLSPELAGVLVKECQGVSDAGPSNTAELDGDTVVIRYFDKRWPLDIADFAAMRGIASDGEAARVMSCL